MKTPLWIITSFNQTLYFLALLSLIVNYRGNSQSSNYLLSPVLHPVCYRTTHLENWYLSSAATYCMQILIHSHSSSQTFQSQDFFLLLMTEYPNGFLFEFYLAVFAALEIKAETKCKYFLIVNPILVKQMYSMKTNVFQNK